jgi:glycosyltransferase involved in cell wall biosynthesis
MKILHVCEYAKGGVATYMRNVLDYQANQHDIYMIVSKNNSEKNYPIKKENIKFYEYKRKPKYFLKAMIEIKQYIDQINPDIIHVHSTFAGLFTRSLLFIFKKKAKIVYCSHGWSFLMETTKIKKLLFSKIEKILSYRTDLIINISDFELHESIKVGLPKKKSVVIHNGVKPPNVNNDISLKIDNKKINLLFIGRFDKQKGLDILLNIFKDINLPNVHLYIIGDSVLSKESYVTNFANLTNIGWVDNNNIDSYYTLFDAVIIPSRWEGFGLVAVEAMRNKKAVIASNRGALPELIKNNVNGYIFDINQKEQLVNILKSLKKETLTQLGREGYRIYKNEFNSDVMNKKIVEVYKRVLHIN